VELNGALSNPFENDKDPLFKLFLLKKKLLDERSLRPRRRNTEPKYQQPRTIIPLTKTVTYILQLADYEPMRLKDIHQACEELLGVEVNYRSLKSCMSENTSGSRRRFVRTAVGRYRLAVSTN